MYGMIKKKIIVILIIFLPILSGCASTSYAPIGSSTPISQIKPIQPPHPRISSHVSPIRSDVCHVVGPLETMWRISKMYDVEIEEIMQHNGLRNKSQLKIGQRLIIPNAAPLKPVIPLYPSRKWKYIVLHHSATDYGSALSFNRAHLKRGFWNGLGYHFVIDNGTMEKQDGQIEVSPRWIKQQDGAHCKAGNMNEKGIGICVVGDFTDKGITRKQMESLVFLINKLSDFYRISPRNVIGHSDAPGASTECPGRNFPWNELRRRLN